MFSGPSHTERHCKKGPVSYACPCLAVEASDSLSAKQFLGKMGVGGSREVGGRRGTESKLEQVKELSQGHIASRESSASSL